MKLVNTFQDRFNEILNLRGLRQIDVAQATNISKELIHKYYIGTSAPKLENLIKLAKFFKVNEVWLMGYDVPMSKDYLFIQPVRVPILGQISAGLPIFADENIEGYDFAPLSIINSDKKYFFLRVRGDSMNIKFNDGDLILVEQDSTLENGEIGVFLIDKEEATVKRFRLENENIILEPMSTNPENHTQIYKLEQVEVIGKVVSSISKI